MLGSAHFFPPQHLPPQLVSGPTLRETWTIQCVAVWPGNRVLVLIYTLVMVFILFSVYLDWGLYSQLKERVAHFSESTVGLYKMLT